MIVQWEDLDINPRVAILWMYNLGLVIELTEDVSMSEKK